MDPYPIPEKIQISNPIQNLNMLVTSNLKSNPKSPILKTSNPILNPNLGKSGFKSQIPNLKSKSAISSQDYEMANSVDHLYRSSDLEDFCSAVFLQRINGTVTGEK